MGIIKLQGNKMLENEDGSVSLIMTGGRACVIDKDDVCLLQGRRVSFDGRYAKISFNGKGMLLHRVILNTPKGMCSDHINGDRLDNRKANLRVATVSQNSWNMGRHKTKYNNKYKGVFWNKRYKSWHASIFSNGVKHYLGKFESEYEAAVAYDKTAYALNGEFARLNFPDLAKKEMDKEKR